MTKRSNFELSKYTELLQAVASMSRLYSENEKAYLDSRFIEKLFIYSSKARDLSRKDNSFDAIINNTSGVGVKTFGVESMSPKSEKIAEFTRLARQGVFKNLKAEELAITASQYRNDRIKTDAEEYNIDLASSFYHCLIRTRSGAIIHEEPYSYININNIRPIKGKEFDSKEGATHFTDGQNNYSFNISKNVLFKSFDLNKGFNSEVIPLVIHEDIFDRILKWYKNELGVKISSSELEKSFSTKTREEIAGVDYVILPLYSSKIKSLENKQVYPRSGINQWNAGGRKRKFGESYIPVPARIHHDYPDFFPQRDKSFKLTLPNNEVVDAKICQDNGKALMTNPNDILCNWLFRTIDPEFSEKKFEKRFDEKKPYTYFDLIRVGKDSVKISKESFDNYKIEFTALNSYEKFIGLDLEEGLDSN
jgi:hypothetical protein